MTVGKHASTAIYNPHLLEREDLLATFVARRPLLDELLIDLRRGGAQHHLLIGARGAGKTSMLLRLAYGIEDDDKLGKIYLPLRFPEEQYNVAHPSDFWINCIDALVDALERRRDRDGVQKLEAEIVGLENVAEDERSARALALLVGFATRKKKLVLLVDNFDLVLDRLRDSHWNIRDALSQDNGITLIGASTTFAQGASYESALYEFFNVHELRGLPEEEARSLVIELARAASRPEVEEIIRNDPGRFKTLFLLTGGMPRTLALLHGLLGGGRKNARVEDDLDRLLDQLTPYYKAQFDDLATQSQVIVDAVALHWHPITAAECASKTRMSVNSVSAQLDRLCRQSILTKVTGSGSRKLAFQIAERFFNIWYLMRASRRLRKRLGWLVEFLRVFYGEEDIRKRAEELLSAPAGRRAVEGGAAKLLAFASAVSDAHLRRRLEFKAIEAIVARYRHPDELQELLDLQGEDSHLAPVIDRAQALRDLKARIRGADVRWPKGTTATAWADRLAGNPSITTQEKIRIGDALLREASTRPRLLPRLTRKAIQLPPVLNDLAPGFYSAVSRGEIPPLPELRTADDLDSVIAAAKGPGRVLAHAVVGSFALAQRAMPETVLRRALEVFPNSGFIPVILLIDYAHRREVHSMHSCARTALEYYKAQGDHTETFSAAFSVCIDFVEAGMAQELPGLLVEAGISDQFLPLYEAARAAAIGPSASLAHLAPEVRVPAERLLQSLMAASEPSAVAKIKSEQMNHRRTRRPTERRVRGRPPIR